MQPGATQARLVNNPCALFACAVATLAATAVPTPAPAHAGASFDRFEKRLVRQINKQRRAHGLARVRRSLPLGRSADYHCADMLRADFFAHSSSNGESFLSRIERFRPSHRIGETLAYDPTRDGTRPARRIVAMWMNSPPHRAALLNPAYRRVGVARRKGRLGGMRTVVYTADFASRR